MDMLGLFCATNASLFDVFETELIQSDLMLFFMILIHYKNILSNNHINITTFSSSNCIFGDFPLSEMPGTFSRSCRDIPSIRARRSR